MHEGAIAQSLITLAEKSVRPCESLRFCFDCLKENSLLSRSELVVECRSRYGPAEPATCPRCGARINLPEADVLQLPYVDWEEEAAAVSLPKAISTSGGYGPSLGSLKGRSTNMGSWSEMRSANA
jgi:Zn finger protein HypA/HybF involved in hydrogenase expression